MDHPNPRQMVISMSDHSHSTQAGVCGLEDQCQPQNIHCKSLCDLCNMTRPAESSSWTISQSFPRKFAHESGGEEAGFQNDDLHPEVALWLWNPGQTREGKTMLATDPKSQISSRISDAHCPNGRNTCDANSYTTPNCNATSRWRATRSHRSTDSVPSPAMRKSSDRPDRHSTLSAP